MHKSGEQTKQSMSPKETEKQ